MVALVALAQTLAEPKWNSRARAGGSRGSADAHLGEQSVFEIIRVIAEIARRIQFGPRGFVIELDNPSMLYFHHTLAAHQKGFDPLHHSRPA